MNKILAVLILLFLPLSAIAAGEFDGIWETSVFDFASIHQSGDSLVIVSLDPGALEWEVFQGDLIGNVATLTTVLSEVVSTIEVTFTSASSVTVLIVSCAPVVECSFQAGQQLTAVKIF